MMGLPLPLLVFAFAFIQPPHSLATSSDPSTTQANACGTQNNCSSGQWCLMVVDNIFEAEGNWQATRWNCVRSSKKACNISGNHALCHVPLGCSEMNEEHRQLIREAIGNMTTTISTSTASTTTGDNVTTTDTTSESSISESTSTNTLPAVETMTSARSSTTAESEPDQPPPDQPFPDQPPAVHKADSDSSNDNQSLSKTTVTVIIVSGIALLAFLGAGLAIWYIRYARKRPKPAVHDYEHMSKKEHEVKAAAAKNERIYDAMSWADTTTHATTRGTQDRGRIVRTEQQSTGAASVIDGVDDASTIGAGRSGSTRSKAKSPSVFSGKEYKRKA